MLEDRRLENAVDRLLKLWPLWVLLASMIGGYIRLNYRVDDLEKNQKQWQSSSEARREKFHEDMDRFGNRLTRLETLDRISE